MAENAKTYFFKCSVSDDLYGACQDASGDPLPTPGGGKWLPKPDLAALGPGSAGYDPVTADKEISKWGCHWFSSQGSVDIYWGPQGPPD